MRRWATALAMILLTAAAHAACQGVWVGADPEHARAVLVDVSDGPLPAPQAHVHVHSGDKTAGDAVVYRIQGKRVTLYWTSSPTATPTAGEPVSMDEVAATRPRAEIPVVQSKPASPEYTQYKDQVTKALTQVDKLLSLLPDVSLNQDNQVVANALVSKQEACSGQCDQVSQVMTKVQDAAPDHTFYSITLEQGLATDVDTIKTTWADYFTQSKNADDHLKAAVGLPKDQADNEKQAALVCHEAMETDVDTLRDTFDKVRNDEAYLQEALEKNN